MDISKTAWINPYHQKNISYNLNDGLNNYHLKVKLTIETNRQRFLDNEIIHNNSMIETWLHTT